MLHLAETGLVLGLCSLIISCVFVKQINYDFATSYLKQVSTTCMSMEYYSS